MDEQLEEALIKLKRDFPLRLPVHVETAACITCSKGSHYFGMAIEIVGVFLIVIADTYDTSQQVDTLWHEWTHCLLWPRCKYRHSARFWTAYGKIYSHYQD